LIAITRILETNKPTAVRADASDPSTNYMTAMTIVTYVHRPKARPKAQPPALTGPAVATPRKRGPKPLEDDPEADARVAAWFARNVRPLTTRDDP
jgi:hypothetical protein